MIQGNFHLSWNGIISAVPAVFTFFDQFSADSDGITFEQSDSGLTVYISKKNIKRTVIERMRAVIHMKTAIYIRNSHGINPILLTYAYPDT